MLPARVKIELRATPRARRVPPCFGPPSRSVLRQAPHYVPAPAPACPTPLLPPPSSQVPIEDSFVAGRNLLPVSGLIAKPEASSPGNKSTDVGRYDPSGLRSTMSANWPALQRSLALARPNHQPTASWEKDPSPEEKATMARFEKQGYSQMGVPRDRRAKGWAYTHNKEW